MVTRIANRELVPAWVATCPTCGGSVQVGVEEWESETGIPTSGGLYVECAESDHEGEIETQMPYVYWLPIQQRVLAWARLALRVVKAGELRPATSREVWRAMAEQSTIRRGLTPWGSLSLTAFMREMVREGGEARVTVVARPDVATRQWWTLDWVGEGKQAHAVAASSLALLLERAAAAELGVRESAEREWSVDVRDGYERSGGEGGESSVPSPPASGDL